MLTFSGRSTPFNNLHSSQTSSNILSTGFYSRELSTDLTESIDDLFRQNASKLLNYEYTNNRTKNNGHYHQYSEYGHSINMFDDNDDSNIIAQMEFDLMSQPSLIMGDKSSVLITLDNIIEAIKIKGFEGQRHLVKYLESFLGLLARESNIEELHYYQKYINTKVIQLVRDTSHSKIIVKKL